MIINQSGTVTAVDEVRFVALAGTRALNGFNDPALRAMYRWYENSASDAGSQAIFDAYAMARQWREINAPTMVAEFGTDNERGLADTATIENVRARLQSSTTVIELGADHYLVRIVSASGPDWHLGPQPSAD